MRMQHLGPVLAFGAAGAGVHGDDGVERVGLAGEHGAGFQFFGKGCESLDVALEIGEDVFAFAGQFEVGVDVAGAADQFAHRRRRGLQGACGRASAAWTGAGSVHRAGSASLVSMSASSLRMRAGSKILPQVAHLVAHGSIGEFEIVQCHCALMT